MRVDPSTVRRALVVLLVCVAASLPAVESLLLVRYDLGATIADYAPEGLGDLTGPHALFWSDELDNWHEVKTAAAHGLSGGY